MEDQSSLDFQGRKRPADSSPGAQQKRQTIHTDFANGEDVTYRVLLPVNACGAIIGKGGATAKLIRDESGVKLQISDSQPGITERLMSLTGPVEVLSTALRLVCQKLAEVQEQDRFGQTSGGTISVKVVVASQQAGAVIGKAGATVKEIRDQTNTTIQVSPATEYPERTVTINGAPESVAHAAFLIAQRLAQHPVRTPAMPFARAGAPALPGRGRPGLPASGLAPFPGQFATASVPFMAGFPSSAAQVPTPLAVIQQTQQLALANDLVGHVIGKGGQRISQLRQLSGANIKIADLAPGANNRVITLSGTPEQIQAATYYINQYLVNAQNAAQQHQQQQH